MRKYIGKYRVVCEFDRNTLKVKNKDDNYIVCKRNGQIYRYSDIELVYYRPSRGNGEQTIGKLKEMGVEAVNISSEGDLSFRFYEKDLDKVAEFVNASTNGADIPPESIKNLRKLDWFKKNESKYREMGLLKEKREYTKEEKAAFRERIEKARECKEGK